MHNESMRVCGECGLAPADPQATRKRSMHGGNRLAFQLWLLLLLGSLVLAMPWVQTRVGWKFAEMDHTTLRDPRPKIVPMVDPLVRWRDVHSAAAGDNASITLLRQAISESIPLTHSALNPELTTLQIEMVQNEFLEQGSKAHMRQYYKGDSEDALHRILLIRDTNEFTRMGWPYVWHNDMSTRLIDYQEVAYSSNPMGIDPEPTSNIEYDHYTQWSWMGIVASIAFAWWSGWLVSRVLKRMRARPMVSTIGRWTVVVGLLSTSLLLGLQPRTSRNVSRFSSAHEAIPSTIDPQTRSIEEMHEQITEDAGVRQIAQQLIERHTTLDRPNALVGLISFSPVRSTNYALRFGYWGETLLSYSQISRFAVDEEGITIPVSAGARRNQPFHISLQRISMNLLAGTNRNTRYLLSIEFAMVLTWLTGAWLLLRLLELAFRPFYRRIQRRRKKKGKCIWCKYPLPSEAISPDQR